MTAPFSPARVAAVVVVAAGATIPGALDQPVSLVAWLGALVTGLVGHLRGPEVLARTATPVAAVLWLQVVAFPLPTGQWTFGLVLGAIASLVALGMALVHRANRVLNFAQAELGTAPAVLVVGLVSFSHWSWFLAVPTGLLAALVLGALVELVVVRRFRRAPRLILTVATIGLSQLLTMVSLLLPRIWGKTIIQGDLSVPWDVRLSDGPPALTGDHVLAIVTVPVIVAALAAFIRFTDVGIAIRASAESSDRAALLGIPVHRLGTAVWVIATGLSFIGVLLRASVVSLPVASTLSFGVLLAALAALVLGGLSDLVAVAAAAVAVGVLEQGVLYNQPDEMVAPVLGAVIVVTMLVRRLGTARSVVDSTASWLAAAEVRPVPAELRRLVEVRAARAALLALAATVVIGFPFLVSTSDTLKGTYVACFVLVAASVVVLTGWSGQVSLGQMSFAAVGAVVSAQAVGEWRLDLSLALLLAGAAGALAAVVIGLPALRLRGPLLGVTTLAFAVASSQFLLNRSRVSFLPNGRFPRPRLFALVDTASERNLYFVAVGVAVLGLVAVRGVRASRTGRVLLAQRDNDRAAAAYGISVVRAKLSAFALSGFLAGVAGGVYVLGLREYTEQPFAPAVSFNIFTASVVGGLGSLAGAVIGALVLNAGRVFLVGDLADWQLLPSALGVLLVLMAWPGGLGDLLYRARDGVLRRVAARRGLVVPSLVADVRTDADADEVAVLRAATDADGAPDPDGPDGGEDGAAGPDEEDVA